MSLKRRYVSTVHSVCRFQFLSATHQKILECVAKVVVEESIDARVDPRRQVAEPREDLENGARYVTSFTAKAIDEIRTEERKPENDKRSEDPDEGLLSAPLPPVHFRRTARR